MIIYLIKSGLCLLALFGLYHFVFGREKMYQFNRYYLLVSLVFGLLIPLNTIQNETPPLKETILFKTEAPNVILKPTAAVSGTTQYLTLENIMLLIYFVVTVILLTRFAMNLFSMLTKIRQGKKLAFDNYSLVLTSEKTLPYTFLGYIFINEDDYNRDRIEPEILEHEKAHAKQYHTFDIVFIELLQLFFWFQPALYGFKKALKFNHEFLADEAVLKKEVPTENYQNLILAKISNKKPVPFSSNLAYLVTKKRFLMMTKQTSTIKSLFLKLAVIPLVAGLTVSFSTYEEAEILPTAIPTTTTENEPQEITDAEYFAGVRLNVYEYYSQTKQEKKYKNLLFSKKYEEFSPEDFEAYGEVFKWFRQKPIEKKAPTENELADFKNDKKYAIWIDGRNVSNSKLDQYKPSDFAHFSGSAIFENARTKKHPQPFQYWFYTHAYYEKNKMGELFKKYPSDKIEVTRGNKTENKNAEAETETIVQEDKNPDFPGGIGEFMKYYAANFNYPKDLKSMEVLRLVVSFNVTKEGGIDNIKMLKGHSKEVDEEVIRVLKASPKWIPGEKNGKKTDAQMTLPIQLQPR